MKQAERTQLENRKKTLIARHSRLCEMYHDDYSADNDILLDVINETLVESEKIEKALSTKNEYLYNFKGGGWNSEFAFTVEEAIQQSKTRWEDSDGLTIDESSFRISTPSDYSNLLSLFY